MQKKIKVVIGEKNLLIGGTQRLAVDQLNLLDQNVFDLHLITLMQVPGKGDFYDLVPPGVKVFKLNFRNARDVTEWWKLIRLIHNIKPDLVKSSGFLGNSIFRILKLFFWYKIVASEYNTNIQRSRPQKFLNKLLAPLTYTIVGDSQMVVDELAKNGGINKKKFTVIYNGVDIKAINESKKEYDSQRKKMRDALGLGQDDKVFLTVARFLKQKNHKLMIDAFKQVVSQRSDCKLLMVGDGVPDMRAALETQIKMLDLEEEVLLVGEQKKLHPFYMASDVFLLTSLHEGFCISAMQGLAFGLPLISTRVAGVIEYLKDGQNGFFTEQDHVDIAAKMLHAANLPRDQFEQLKQHAVSTAQEYSLERYGSEYNALFKKAVGYTD